MLRVMSVSRRVFMAVSLMLCSGLAALHQRDREDGRRQRGVDGHSGRPAAEAAGHFADGDDGVRAHQHRQGEGSKEEDGEDLHERFQVVVDWVV